MFQDKIIKITSLVSVTDTFIYKCTYLFDLFVFRTLSAVGPQRPSFYPVPAPSPLTSAEANNSSMGQVVKQKASQKPHRSLSFAGHTNQARRPQTAHPSVGIHLFSL